MPAGSPILAMSRRSCRANRRPLLMEKELFRSVRCVNTGETESQELKHTRIIDEALPTDSRSWLLKVNAHNDVQIVLRFLSVRSKFASVLKRRFYVMYRAWPS